MFNRPELKTIKVEDLKRENLEYFCKTSAIDEMVMKRRGLKFDKELSEAMEKDSRMYFVVKSNRQYDVLSSLVLEPWLKANGIVELPLSDKARFCREHYIKKLFG